MGKEDIEFLKELEALKLKQKLLIDSVKKKVSSERDNSVLELSSKIDFLVKIFSDIKNNDDNSKKDFDIFKEEILDKVESLSDYVHSYLDKMKKEIKEDLKKELLPHRVSNNFSNNNSNENNSDNAIPKQDKEVSLNAIPKPDFLMNGDK